MKNIFEISIYIYHSNLDILDQKHFRIETPPSEVGQSVQTL